MMIELAPTHKIGLALANPIMPAAGCFGLGSAYGDLVDPAVLGAIVVGPLTARPRRGAPPPRIVPFAGGVLVHTGLANPGVSAAVRHHARAWGRLAVPVIVHVAGVSVEEADRCCRRLTGVDGVAGIELGLPDSADRDEVLDVVAAAREAARPPLLVRLPFAGALDLCEAIVEAGVDALVVAGPPRGTLWSAGEVRFVTGRLYGPLVLPQLVRIVRRVADRVSVPLVGSGGVHSAADAQTLLRAGAVAVQVGDALWRDPGLLVRTARLLAEPGDDPVAEAEG